MGPPSDRVLKNTLTDGAGNMSIDGLATLIKNLHAETDKKLHDLVKMFDVKVEKLYGSIEEKLNDLDDKFKSLKSEADTEIQRLKTECNTKINEVEIKIDHKFNEIDRRALDSDLVVFGIPHLENEKADELALKIINKFGLNPSVVTGAFRLTKWASAKVLAPIILKCTSPQSKRIILAKYFEIKSFNLRDIGFDVSTRIYINEPLTKNDRLVKQYALKLQKEGKIHKVSVRNCQVMVKWKQDAVYCKVNMCDLTI